MGPSGGARGPDGREWIRTATARSPFIDPATNTVTDTVTIGGKPFVVRSAFGALWAGDFDGSRIRRIHP